MGTSKLKKQHTHIDTPVQSESYVYFCKEEMYWYDCIHATTICILV